MTHAAQTTFRPLGPDDFDQWSNLWCDYLSFYKTTLPAGIYTSTFNRLTESDNRDVHGLVAVQKNRLVGLVHYLFHRHCWRIEDVCYLQDLYADPAVRGQGIGRQLIQAVYDAADKAGAPSVYWLTQKDNSPARKLYDRVGTLTNFIKYQRPA